MCLCRSHTAAWIASNHFRRKLICIYTMCLIHQSYQVQCTTKTLKQQSDKHLIESTTAHTHTACFKEVIEEISPWCKYCQMKISTLLDDSIQMLMAAFHSRHALAVFPKHLPSGQSTPRSGRGKFTWTDPRSLDFDWGSESASCAHFSFDWGSFRPLIDHNATRLRCHYRSRLIYPHLKQLQYIKLEYTIYIYIFFLHL